MKIQIYIGLFLTALMASNARSASPRTAAPDAPTEVALRQAVQHQYSDLYNSPESTDRLALAKTLLSAVNTAGSAGAAYALLCEARDVTARAGDLPGSMRIAGVISDKYTISISSARVGALAAGAQGIDGQLKEDAWFSMLISAIDQSMLTDDFDPARRMLEIGQTTIATRQADFWSRPLATRQADLETQFKAYTTVKPAIEQLQRNPDDPITNLAVGKYDCFIKGNWQAGLPLLDRGIDDQIHLAARMEIWEPKNSVLQLQKTAKNGKVQIMVADRWEALRASNPDSVQLNVHTFDWYMRALPSIPDNETTDRNYIETELARLVPLVETHRPNAAMWVAIADAMSRKAITQSPIVGGKSAVELFQNIPETGGLLVGFHVGMAMLYGDKVITFLQPIYLTSTGEFEGTGFGRQISKLQTLHAPAGYAIGALRISGDTGLNSITAWYMRIAGNRLSTTNRLKPVQLGGTGGTAATYGGRGDPIVGICGKQHGGVLGLGLIFPRPANLSGTQSASVK